MKGILLAWLMILTLAGCGGGGGDSGSTSSLALPVGVWVGTSDTGKDSGVVVLPSGKAYSVYSDAGGLAGAVVGNMHMSAAFSFDFTAKDYGVDGSITAANVTGTFREQQDMSVTVTETDGTITSSLLYQDLPAVTFADIAGTYDGDDGTFRVTTTIQSDGTITTLADNGCATSGTLSQSGIDSAFSASLTYNNAACGTFSGETINGALVYDATNHGFYAAAHNANLTAGGILQGALITTP